MSSHLQNVTVDNTEDLQRLKRGVEIRRPKKKRNLQNDTRIKACIARYDAGAYAKLQFLRAISHSLGIHSARFLAEEVDSDDENDDVNIDEQQQQPSGPATSATAAADATSARSATCEVCLLAPRDGVVLVPCGHSRFCAQCADAVAVMPNGCPLCRTPIDMVMHVYF